jgi:hypothetical protein
MTISVRPAIFPAGESMSEIVDLKLATAVVGVVMAAENWRPAVVTVQGSPDGVNFYDLHDGTPGTELVFNVTPSTMVMLNPNRLRSCQAIILRSGTKAAPVVQDSVCIFGVVIEN